MRGTARIGHTQQDQPRGLQFFVIGNRIAGAQHVRQPARDTQRSRFYRTKFFG